MSTREQRTAVVTGGAAGIGEAISLRLVRDGFSVVIADRDLDRAHAVAQSEAAQGRVRAMRVEVTSGDSLSALFESIAQNEGSCDALVNNAGIAPAATFAALELGDWERTIAVNLTGAMLASQAVLPGMVERGWGRIVNIASISGIRAGVLRSAYGTSKAALIGLTRQIAIEVAERGVTVNAVAPGPVDTEMTRALHTDATRKNYLRSIPMRRYGSPEEIAAVVSFLCSDASSYVTGHTIPVDGGFLAAGILEA